MEWLIELDHKLFARMNGQWTNPFFDRFFPAITDLIESPITWTFVAALLAMWLYKEPKRALRWLLILGLSLATTDLFAYRVLKPFVSRNRPGFAAIPYVLRTNVHQGNSFPSNHAANMFALAVVLSSALPRGRWLFYLIAFLVAYSRVYVGVHFPFDVFGGAVTGLAIGWVYSTYLGDWADTARSVGDSSRGRRSNRSS